MSIAPQGHLNVTRAVSVYKGDVRSGIASGDARRGVTKCIIRDWAGIGYLELERRFVN